MRLKRSQYEVRDRDSGETGFAIWGLLLTHVKAYIEDLANTHPWTDPQPPGEEADKVSHVLMRDVNAFGLASGACALHQYRVAGVGKVSGH